MKRKQKAHDVKDALLLIAFLFSGCAALADQMLWTRLLSISLGCETLGITGILIGFFGGMAIGAYVLDKPIKNSATPIRWFIGLECIIAIFTVVSPYVLIGLSRYIPEAIGPVAGSNGSISALLISTGIAGLLLLPATASMGGTLAALVEARRRVCIDNHIGKGLGRLYAANTFGAMLGVLGGSYYILPKTGYALGAVLFASLGIIAAIAAAVWKKRSHFLDVCEQPEAHRPDFRPGVYGLLFGTGLLGIGLEIVAVHILTQLFQNTVYTYANILAVYLFGTAVGAWLYQRFYRSQKSTPSRFNLLLLGLLSLSVLWVGFMLKVSPAVFYRFTYSMAPYHQQIIVEIFISLMIFSVPTLLMGACFSHLMAQVASNGVGKAYCVNTLGGTFSPIVLGLFSIKWVGLTFSLMVIMIGYLTLAAYILMTHYKRVASVVLYSLACGLMIGVFPKKIHLLSEEPSAQWIERKEGLFGVVSVYRQKQDDSGRTETFLKVNENFRMGGNRSFPEKRMGHMAMLLHDRPKRVAFLGIGAGATLSSTAQYDAKIDAVELVPEVLDMLHYFDSENNNISTAPNIHYHAADARRFMAAASESYDLVLADLYHPMRNGTAFLYTQDHYRMIKQKLASKGLCVQLLPLHQFDDPSLKTVIRTFVSVFNETHCFLASYNIETPALVLVGTKDKPLTIQASRLILDLMEGTDAYNVFTDINDFFASYFMTQDGLMHYAGEGPLNRDLTPWLLFNIPDANKTFDHPSQMKDLLDYRQPFPETLLQTPKPELVKSAHRTWAASGAYLRGEVERKKGRSSLEWYLKAYDIDPDFPPARGVLLKAAATNPDLESIIEKKLLPRDRDRIEAYRSMFNK